MLGGEAVSFFHVGDCYRGAYEIEHVVPFFQGEMAIAQLANQYYYLQYAHLQKTAPSRAIQQYRYLEHEQLIPFLNVFTEENALVFIRPYEPIRPLLEVVSSKEVPEEKAVVWLRKILLLEQLLQSKPMPMYILLDPRNIGVNEQGELKVLFVGLEQIMAGRTKLDWGTFLYSILSGQYLDGPIVRIPNDFPVSKKMHKLISKTLKEYKINPVLAQIDTYEASGRSFFDRLVSSGKGAKRPQASPVVPKSSSKETESTESTSPHQHATSNDQELSHPLPNEQAPSKSKEHSERKTIPKEESPIPVLDDDSISDLVKEEKHPLSHSITRTTPRSEKTGSKANSAKITIQSPIPAENVDSETWKAAQLVQAHEEMVQKAEQRLNHLQEEFRRESERILKEVERKRKEQEEQLRLEREQVEKERRRLEQEKQQMQKGNHSKANTDVHDELAKQFEQFMNYRHDQKS